MIGKFVLSRHAEQERVRRQIPLSVVDSVLQHPDERLPGGSGLVVYQGRRPFENGKIYLVRLIVAEDRTPQEIVTLYRTSKIGKYLRNA